MKKYRSQLLFAISIGLALIAVSVNVNLNKTRAQTSLIPSTLALELAQSYSIDDGLIGGALTPSSKAYGQVMTYEEAIQFVFGKPIDSNTQIYTIREKAVWLIILEGEFVSHAPASADGVIPAKDVIHSQMGVILDATTGEILRRTLISPEKELPVTDLPVLEGIAEQDTPFILPTPAPVSTEIPFYQTLTP